MKKFLFAALCLGLVAGCGGIGDDDDDDGTNPGGGTGTLLVDAEVDVDESVPNALDASQFSADLVVNVTKGGAAVIGAQVIITAGGSQLTLTESVTIAGRYEGALSTYHQTYGLDITAGTDTIVGARLVGPAFHTITTPAHNSVHPAGQDLLAEWGPSGSTSASIETSEMNSTNTQDTGIFTIPAAMLNGDPGEVADDEVIVRREAQTNLAGGFAGSTLRVRVRNKVDFQLDAT